jgi:iron only hydrogenase large subunit-like protein
VDDVKVVVVSVSPQTRASLAAKYGLSPLQVARRVTAFLKGLGVDQVFDTSFSRDMSLLESQREFVERFRAQGTVGQIPMLASACPGWICYAEKTHGSYILPYISTTKSPQQIMGTLVKEYFGEKLGKKYFSFFSFLSFLFLFFSPLLPFDLTLLFPSVPTKFTTLP